SLESRSFSSTSKRTFLNELKLQKLDYFLIILYTLLFIFTILIIINPALQPPSLSQVLNI
ncbi:MAG: hypothetical protein ACFFD2_27310, partial [Promethearchaeota archaeon]